MQWEDYFWPGTKVLANKLDIHEAAELTRVEHSLARGRAIELGNGAVDIPSTFDGDHIRRLHHWLFQDVYSWAGLRELLQLMHHSTLSELSRLNSPYFVSAA